MAILDTEISDLSITAEVEEEINSTALWNMEVDSLIETIRGTKKAWFDSERLKSEALQDAKQANLQALQDEKQANQDREIRQQALEVATIQATAVAEATVAANRIPQRTEPAASGTSSIRLPKIDLPSFSGVYSDWTSFVDMFKASVSSNTKLSKA